MLSCPFNKLCISFMNYHHPCTCSWVFIVLVFVFYSWRVSNETPYGFRSCREEEKLETFPYKIYSSQFQLTRVLLAKFCEFSHKQRLNLAREKHLAAKKAFKWYKILTTIAASSPLISYFSIRRWKTMYFSPRLGNYRRVKLFARLASTLALCENAFNSTNRIENDFSVDDICTSVNKIASLHQFQRKICVQISPSKLFGSYFCSSLH